MKICSRQPLITLLILLFLQSLPLTAIAKEGETFRLPVPEDFRPALNSEGSPLYIAVNEIEKNIRKHSKKFKKVRWNREIKYYIIPQHEWMKSVLAAYEALRYQFNVRGKADNWDCENFSQLLNAMTTVLIWRAGYYDTRGALGWLKVDAQKSWAGMPAEMHALMFVVTEKGFFVFEPQNGEAIELENYPNRHFIQEVYLF